jgi:myo-inositol-1(or 4)-monophosphatase
MIQTLRRAARSRGLSECWVKHTRFRDAPETSRRLSTAPRFFEEYNSNLREDNVSKENDLNPRLTIAIRAARQAGALLRNKFEHPLKIRSNGKRDIVTDADYAADRMIRQTIHSEFPSDLFLSEEDDAAVRQKLWRQSEKAVGANLWIVDPLDGTANYAHSVPAFAVSIALYSNGAVQLGVVYDPIRDELFAAEKGRGASLNGAPINVGRRPFTDAIVSLEWGRKPGPRAKTSAILARLMARTLTARSKGSAALSMCYVAAGRFDIYFHLSLSPWDIAAAACIVEEAGGRVTNTENEPWHVHSKQYVASNGVLHANALRNFRA